MTANKGFKKLVRERMQQTGLSYAAARHSLTRRKKSPMTPTRDELYAAMATMQTTIREFLAPIAAEYDKPLDPGLVSAIMFEREKADDTTYWFVHLYTLSPGLVIGPKGTVAGRLRAELSRVSDDPNLRLNLIDFAKIHAARSRLLEPDTA